MTMQFQKATRRKARLRLGLTGPSGSGKTLGALMIAKGIGGSIALIDTEHESASLYAEPVPKTGGDLFQPPEFDTLNLAPPYTPERFIEAIHAAEKAEYDILVIDGATPEWSGSGGCLELVDQLASAKFKGNSWSAWNEITPRHRAFLDAILRSPLHIIVTVRSKTETAQTEENGRKRVVKLGMKAEQRDGLEYELTTVLDLIHDGHYATASKDRTGLFVGDPKPISESTGEILREWLENGAQVVGPDVLAIQALDACETADAFRETWNKNKAAWRDVMGDVAYQRVVDHMKALAPKFAPPKTDEPPAGETVTTFRPRQKAVAEDTADTVIVEMRALAGRAALDQWTDANMARINKLGAAGIDAVQLVYSELCDAFEAAEKPAEDTAEPAASSPLADRAFMLESALKACAGADDLRATYDAAQRLRDDLAKADPARLEELDSLYEGLFLTARAA